MKKKPRADINNNTEPDDRKHQILCTLAIKSVLGEDKKQDIEDKMKI